MLKSVSSEIGFVFGRAKCAVDNSAFELPARLSFQFALSAMGVSKIRQLAEIWGQKLPIILNLRQVIGSSGGKELLQVTHVT